MLSHPYSFRLFLPAVALLALSLPACAGDAPSEQTPKAAQSAQSTDATTSVDANNDGVISAAELVAFREKQRHEQLLKQAERQLARMDTDKDGKVSVAEFEAGSVSRIAPASPEVAARREQRSALISEKIEARRAQMQAEGSKEAAQKAAAPTK